MAVKYVTGKYNGDDNYSWAVFRKGENLPIINGLSLKEARYFKVQFEKEEKYGKQRKMANRGY